MTDEEIDALIIATGCNCDFSSGTRGMDRCSKCDGTGSRLRINVPDGILYFPNTKLGYQNAVEKLKK